MVRRPGESAATAPELHEHRLAGYCDGQFGHAYGCHFDEMEVSGYVVSIGCLVRTDLRAFVLLAGEMNSIWRDGLNACTHPYVLA